MSIVTRFFFLERMEEIRVAGLVQGKYELYIDMHLHAHLENKQIVSAIWL